MADFARMRSLGWTFRRLGVSLFLLVHLVATVLWVLPPCPVRAACLPVARYYMLPLGLGQYWGMFSPDPVRETLTLEAEVVDARGLRSTFPFPRMADYSKWRGIPRFRYPKYTANLANPDVEFDRKVAARHAVRKLEVPDDAFPVNVNLVFQVRRTPPPGGPPADPMIPPEPIVIANFQFETPAEVRR